MGIRTVEINIPSLTANEIFLDYEETRAVLNFFWPSESGQIERIPDSLEIRQFAQQILIAGVDASYQIGYVDILFSTFMGKPTTNILKVLQKLGKKSAKHWYKHATGKDLSNPKIYLMARNAIAFKLRHKLNDFASGIALKGGGEMRFFAHVHTPTHLS